MGQVIASLEELNTLLKAYRQADKTIVTTNGCFDLLHVGHLRYLQQAKAQGDVLVVALNSDRSVQGLKGPTRPIVPEADRAELLAGLNCVDAVVLFDEATPEAVLKAVQPDIHVKGGDYTPETLPEKPLLDALGTELRLVPVVENRSTTGLVERIQGLTTTPQVSKRPT